jgi:hypothetical protein
MLRDNETFSSAIIIDAFGDVLGKHVMLGMDEPEHGRHRSLVAKAFSQKAMTRWEDELVGKVAKTSKPSFSPRYATRACTPTPSRTRAAATRRARWWSSDQVMLVPSAVMATAFGVASACTESGARRLVGAAI